MKLTFLIITIFLVPFCLACEKQAQKTEVSAVKPPSPQPSPTSTNPKDGNYNGKGRITKIDMEIGSVELDHEDIPGVMPPMIMEFYVRDPLQMKSLKVGDQVDFVLEYKHPSETIISIKEAR